MGLGRAMDEQVVSHQCVCHGVRPQSVSDWGTLMDGLGMPKTAVIVMNWTCLAPAAEMHKVLDSFFGSLSVCQLRETPLREKPGGNEKIHWKWDMANGKKEYLTRGRNYQHTNDQGNWI